MRTRYPLVLCFLFLPFLNAPAGSGGKGRTSEIIPCSVAFNHLTAQRVIKYFEWEVERGKVADPFVTKTADAIAQYTNGPLTMIDFGVGGGLESRYLLQTGRWDVTAIDAFDEVLRYFESLVPVPDRQRLTLRRDTFESMILEKDSADLAVALQSLTFVNNEALDLIVEKISRSLKPDGYFVGSFYGDQDALANVPHVASFTIGSLKRRLLRAAKLEVVKERVGKSEQYINGRKLRYHAIYIIAKKAG